MKQKVLSMLVLLMMAVMGAVAQTDVSTFAQLQSALNAGNDVRLTGNISFSSAITISGGKKVTINGNGKTLSGPSTRAFSVTSGSTLAIKNATLNNFDLNAGGGATRNNGTLVLDGCIVSNNHTDGSNQGGGAIENQGKFYASNTTFSGNYSSEIGGAINNYQGSLYLSGCTFINNYTSSTNAKYGGAIGNNSSGTLVLVNCTFSGNKYGGSSGSASDLGVYRTTSDYTIAGCAGITITGATMTTYPEGSADLDFSDLDNIKFVPSIVAKYDITLSEESTAHGTVTFSVGGVAATQAKKGDVVTITVVPGEGYSTKKVTVRAYTSWGNANARGLSAPVLQDEITVNAGQTAGTWTFTMPEANVWVVVTYARELQDSWIQPIANQYYTGSAIEPVVTVKDGSTTLTPGTDYTVSYDNNVEVGMANVTITAVNGSDYSGTASSTFVIERAENKLLKELYDALGSDVWTGYGERTGVISYSRGDDPQEFRAMFMGGTFTIDLPFTDFTTVTKADNGDESYTYTLVVNLPAQTGMSQETLHVTTKNGEITSMESENAGLEMSKENSGIDSWTALQSAINAGGVIKLTQTIIASVTDAALTVPEGKTVVLELNGQTVNRALTSAAVDGSVIINNGVLAITDTDGGKIIGGNTTGNGGGILNNGTLTLYGGEITGNKAAVNGGGVYNTVTNTSTTGFWMTGGLIDNNTAGSHPAIGGDVTFNNLALIQINADGTKVSVSEAIAGMSGYSYVKPVMPDPESYYVVTAPTPKTGLSYTGAEQELVDAGSTTFGVMEYSLDGMAYATAIPTGTEAGKYTVYYRVMGDATHNDYAPQTVTVNIALASLTIHAGEYASYYCGKGLSLAEGTPDGIVLSTVIAVNGTDGSVTLASDLQSAAANTPLIIYNGTDEDQQVLLDVNEQAATVNYDTEHFFGTLEAKDFTATDIAASDHYVLDGVNFTWVKDAGTIAANKCWIELVPASEAHARTLSIVFEGETDPTAVSAVKAAADGRESGVWYDLNGRRYTEKPTAKGIYVKDGKKVLIK